MNKKQKAEISVFYDLYKKEKGEKMYYKFKCENCGKGKNKGNQNSRKGFYRMYTKEGVLVKTFETQRQITEYFLPKKVALGTINATAHNVGYRKTAYGYKWEYVNESK